MTHTQRHSDEEICVRCGLSKSEWSSRRWQDPLCRVGETTYEQHTTTTDKRSRMSVLGDNENVYIRCDLENKTVTIQELQ